MNTAKKPIILPKPEASRTQQVVLPGQSPSPIHTQNALKNTRAMQPIPPTARNKAYVPSFSSRQDSHSSSRNGNDKQADKNHPRAPVNNRPKIIMGVIGAVVLIFVIILIASSSQPTYMPPPRQVVEAPPSGPYKDPHPIGEWGKQMKAQGESQELKERRARLRGYTSGKGASDNYQ